MESILQGGVIKVRDTNGMLPRDVIARREEAWKTWIEIRECGLDSEQATNRIEQALQRFYDMATPRNLEPKKMPEPRKRKIDAV